MLAMKRIIFTFEKLLCESYNQFLKLIAMKKTIYTILISQLILLGTNLNAQDCADPANIYFFAYAGTDYEIVKENLSWTDAAACAVERGGFLSQVDSQEEQDSIFYHLNNAGIDVANTVAPDGGGASYVWIGGNDIAVEGVWIWDGDNDGNGEQFWEGDYNGNPINGLYNNWGGEPDNWNTQNGLGLALTSWPYGVPGQWNDVDDSNSLYYIIEYENTIGIRNHDKGINVLVYPNPATEFVYIQTQNDQTITQVNIYNQMGVAVIKNGFSQNFPGSIDIGKLTPGLYYVNITIENGAVANRLIVIE
ncbi:MAG: hypothetical protein DRJ05_17895 [Bacteroidetes bacterium]|nr:MAG: hypothetical protein DRJ05_17895 [Bacteroidota bacterium]